MTTNRTDNTIIPSRWVDFPESIRVRLGREAGPQRAMLEDGHLLIILHECPRLDEPQRIPHLFWRLPNGEWKASIGKGASGIQDLFNKYTESLVRLDEAENKAADARSYHSVLEELGPILRSSRGLHRALQQARDLVKAEKELINYRDSAAATERSAELLLQDAEFGLNFVVAKQAESQAAIAKSQAAASHRLNLLVALFLPITTLATLYGMSVKIPHSDFPNIFWIICAVGFALGFLLWLLMIREQDQK